MKKLILAAAMAFALATPAVAHTAFILPASFWPTSQDLDAQSGFASTFFVSDVASAPDINVIAPDGSRGTPDRVEVTPTATNIGHDLLQSGTYRITTGEKLGQVATLVSDGAGGWRALAQGETPPPNTQTTTLQTVTVADAYVTRGEATRTTVDAPIGRLALHPITHPDQVFAAQGFDVELLFDGRPFPNMPIVLYAENDPDTKLDRYVVTDADGRAHITFDAPGKYVIAVRHRAAAPAGSAAAVQSFTTTLTLQAYDVIPTVRAEPAEPTRRQAAPVRRRAGRQDR